MQYQIEIHSSDGSTRVVDTADLSDLQLINGDKLITMLWLN